MAYQDVERLSQAFEQHAVDRNRDGAMDSREFLDLYLTKALRNRVAPEIAISGKGNRVLGNELSARLGKDFSSDERQRIHERLDPYLAAQGVESTMTKIRNATDEYSIDALEYGPALAVVLATGD